MSNKDIEIELNSRMFTNCTSVSVNRNIVLSGINTIHEDQLSYILSQYFQFPRNIVSILVTAAYNFGYYGWTDVVSELRQNVFEELGGGGGHIASDFGPHYSIVRKEMEKLFEFDLDESKPSPATARFIERMKLIAQSEPWTAAGGVIAMEVSAVPELGIVKKLVTRLAEMRGKTLTERLGNFFQFHVNVIEIGHRERLISLVASQLSDPSNFEKFIEGFDSLLGAMDTWWSELNVEATVNYHEITLHLT